MKPPRQAREPSRRQLLGAGGLVLLLGVHELAWGARILAVRVWPARDYTRVTLESDEAIVARQFFIADPPRVGVDITGLELQPALRELVAKVQPDDPNIAGIRVGQNAPGVVRLVIDLKQPVQPQVFSLRPVEPYQHRLVMDLYPTQAPDPLEALIAEKLRERAGLAGAAPAADPLGELMADQARRSAAQVPAATAGASGDAASPAAAPTARAAASAPGSGGAHGQTATPGGERTERLIIVALDPGHGGEDPGAIGPGGTREKDVVLQMALLLRERINARPNMRAFLTRDGDFFVPLHVRVQKARRVQADLFISIHADAFFTPRPQGASVFVLSERGATSSAARWLADKENAADGVGGVNIQVRDRHVRQALLDMSTTAQINDSLQLGSAMLGEIRRVGRLHKPRVEQAGFAVLKAPDIPSVLVETAFISNPDEERRLRDPDYQNQLMDALMRGIERYFAKNPPLARNRPV